MKKLKLNLEDLQIESFEIKKEHKSPKGTIKGEAYTWPNDLTCQERCWTEIDKTCPTCQP